jgi:hypothetical protein
MHKPAPPKREAAPKGVAANKLTRARFHDALTILKQNNKGM